MKTFLSVLLILIAAAAMFFAVVRTLSFIKYRRRKLRKNPDAKLRRGLDVMTYGLYAAALLLIAVVLIIPDKKPAPPPPPAEDTAEEAPPPPEFSPQKTDETDPRRHGINWEIIANGSVVPSFTREDEISFSAPADYFALPGIATFRGNNYRNSASYGSAQVTEETLHTLWTAETGQLEGTSWAGSGWTGQPLIVKWDEQTRMSMNLYPDKKTKENLTEVIYATLDGCIYFLDLEDGSATREPLNMGICFKGSGSLDPRGYPLLYVGAGDVNGEGQRPRMFIISLIDCTVLYEYGSADPNALRNDNNSWCAFDSAPLVDADTDTLIWPGENGILYTFKLNTSYDISAGTLSISPDAPVSTRYTTAKNTSDSYWYGYEASANIVENYLYISENGGMFYCVDLNTMELVWAQDTKDDSNSSPVFERISVEEGYIYTAPSLHWTADENSHGTINIYKLNAITGEIVWQKPYDVYTVSGVSGGVQSTPLLGKQGSSIEGLIIYTIARTPSEGTGLTVALDTKTGEEVWRIDMDAYTWSSPAAIYENDGTAYIAVCDSWGFMRLINGSTGEILYTHDLGYLIEASPAVFNNTIVIGTRGQKIYAVNVQ